MPPKKESIGHRFGKLIVIEEVYEKNKRRKVKCICDCGNETITDPRFLFIGHTKSCGCYQKEIVAKICKEKNTTHGMSNTDEYNIWCHMKARCYNKKNKKYKDYGGRGIKVCQSWKNSFDIFLRDMGKKPTKYHSIDRIDVNGDYCKDNCKWSTNAEQALNKRKHRFVYYYGEKMPLAKACKLLGVNYRSALYRLNKGKDWKPIKPPKQEGARDEDEA